MAFSGLTQLLDSQPAATDLSTNQFQVVLFNATPELALAGATAGPGFVLQDKPDAQGVNGTILLGGKGKVEIGASVDAGDYLTTDASGLAVTAAPATGVNDEVFGIALEDGANSGELIKFLVNIFTMQGA